MPPPVGFSVSSPVRCGRRKDLPCRVVLSINRRETQSSLLFITMVTSLGFSNWHALLWKSENHNRAISILTKTTSYQEPKNFSITVSHAPPPSQPDPSGQSMSEPSMIPLWLVSPRWSQGSVTSGHSRLCRKPVSPDFFLEVTLFFAWGPFAQESSSPLIHGPPRVPRARHSRNILVPCRLPGRPPVCPARFAHGG